MPTCFSCVLTIASKHSKIQRIQSTHMEGKTSTGYMLLGDPLMSMIKVWFIIIILLYFNNHNHLGICYRGHPILFGAIIRNEDQHLTLSFKNFRTT